MENIRQPKVGERFQSGQHKGTIRFIGVLEVVSPTQRWVGVEWDNENRGKHDGIVKGKRIFQARSQKAASFLKFEQFIRKTKPTCTFMEGVRERYQNEVKKNEEMFIEDKGGKLIEIEFVGKEKVLREFSMLQKLLKISVCNSFVRGVFGDEDEENEVEKEIAKNFGNLEVLDLSNTLMGYWNDAVVLCRNMKNLRILILSENFWIFGDYNLSNTNECLFPNLEEIVLNNIVSIRESEIYYVESFFPNVSEFRICSNQLKKFEMKFKNKEIFKKLKLLNLADNQIDDFHDIQPLIGNVTSREFQEIILSENNFRGIPRKLRNMENIEKLVLNENKIKDYTSIDNLSFLCPKLVELVIHNNPLEKIYPEHTRIIIIAKIHSLEVLNKSEISTFERKEAEKYYLRKYIIEKREICRKENERDLELIKKYPDISERSYEKIVRKEYVQVELNIGRKKRKKKLKLTMRVEQLKILCKRLFKIDDKLQTLCFLLNDSEMVLDDDSQSLSFYCLYDNCVIMIRERDLEKERLERERKDREFEESVQKQEMDVFKQLEWKKQFLES